jgi:hypothetical protein
VRALSPGDVYIAIVSGHVIVRSGAKINVLSVSGISVLLSDLSVITPPACYMVSEAVEYFSL